MSKLPRIGSLGAGRMGRGIAHAFAYAGHEVLLIDGKPREAQAAARLKDEALREIRASLDALAELAVLKSEEVLKILARVRFVPFDEAPRALAEVDVLFEGVPEVLEAKRTAL